MNHEWLEGVRRSCVGRGLPTPVIERIVAELRDHLADLMDPPEMLDGTTRTPADARIALSAEDRLGAPELLAASAVANLRAASFAARHPAWTFLALPVPLTIAGWALMLAITIGLFRLGNYLPLVAPLVKHRPVAEWPAIVLYLVSTLEFVARVLPPVLSTILLCRWSQRALHGWRWSLAACALVAALFGLFVSKLELPLQPHGGRWSLGLMLPGGREQLLQLLIPPVVALWWIYRCRAMACRTLAASRNSQFNDSAIPTSH